MGEKQTTFLDLNLQQWLINRCATIGIRNPTPVQENCIREILKGKNCIGISKTGSGKTLAFALPILQELYNDPYGIFALILTPTRELAFQIQDQFAVIGKPLNIRCCTIVGGMDMVQQGRDLTKKPHIVVATPGRLADHIDSCNTFSLQRIRFLVLDEADRLLSGAFDKQLKTIFHVLPKQKQTLFFSATEGGIRDLMDLFEGDAFLYKQPSETATVEQLKQHFVLCPLYALDAYLIQTICTFRETNENQSIIIFTNKCRNCQILSMVLNNLGFENVALHSMLHQKQRMAALARFRSSTAKILVATDVASRGLDIPFVQLVINHSVPQQVDDYVHRVGRTARAGRAGVAITLLDPGNVEQMLHIEKALTVKWTAFKIDDQRVGQILTQISVAKSEAALQLDEEGFSERSIINKRKQWLLEGKDPDEEEKKLLNKFKKKRKHNKSTK